MTRAVFLCPFARTEISGGIKTAYRQAELLAELGLEACVYQPDGAPVWLETRASIITAPRFSRSDILVFPETLNGSLADLVRLPVRKVLFCQAHYYTLFNPIAPERYRALGFEKIICQSLIAKGFLERVLGLNGIATIPCFIDREVFFPRGNFAQIALIPRKLPREAAAIQKIFTLKYPRHAAIAWLTIDNRSERETAEIFGSSCIVLSLPFLESFGLVPLEAMASGAIVAGFTGYGGQEYASEKNGFWFAPDHLEEVADSLAFILEGLESGKSAIAEVREAGFATARNYDKDRARAALNEVYRPLLA